MNIFITGGLGFVGRQLSTVLLRDGHRITAVGRTRQPRNMIHDSSFVYLAADTTQPGEWQQRLPTSDIVVNLAGKSIFTVWTRKNKDLIHHSRIATTRHLVEGLAHNGRPLFISASAAGYYGDRGEDYLCEEEPPGSGFLARVGQDWELEALKARAKGARVVTARFGIVLGKGGGAMAKMQPLFQMYAGGWLGNGRQWFPWIHLLDLVAAFRFIISHSLIEGPVNCCAPEPVRHKELSRALGAKLHRPVLLFLPALAVKALLGEFGVSLLHSQRVRPAVLQKAGFKFRYPDIDSALEQITRG